MIGTLMTSIRLIGSNTDGYLIVSHQFWDSPASAPSANRAFGAAGGTYGSGCRTDGPYSVGPDRRIIDRD